jgi:hypothetical protein
VSQTLSADPGGWSGNPTHYSYQWFNCDANFFDCPNITGATGPTYVVQPADLGQYIGVEVVASNANGDSAPADSDVIGPVAGGGAAPVNLTAPLLSGTAQAGQMLTVGTGTWSGNPTGYKYQWYSCDNALGSCNAIPAATGSAYLVSPGDLGRRMLASVVATNATGDSVPERSNPTDPVLPAPPSLLFAPTISGTAQVGHTLTADPGTWSNTPTGYQYHWERCSSAGAGCTSIAGAGGASYPLTAADVGTRVVVEVVAVNPGGQSAPGDSSATAVVAGPSCDVPNVVRLKLAAAKSRIRDRHCSVGRITRKPSRPAKHGRVVRQSPEAGKTLANGAKVNLTVGRA